MRRLLLLAVLASACDQGAHAAPTPAPARVVTPAPPPAPPVYERYTVKNDADFIEKVRGMFAELTQVFAAQDCERLAAQITQFGEGNVTRFAVLTEYGKDHPGIEKQMQDRMKPEVDALMKVMMTSLQPCMQDRHVTTAIQKLSELGNLTQHRPR
jgi:hypothetical protein